MSGWGVNYGICDVMKSTLPDCLSQIERVIRRIGDGSLALRLVGLVCRMCRMCIILIRNVSNRSQSVTSLLVANSPIYSD